MVIKELSHSFTAEDAKFIEDMNKLSLVEQTKLILKKAEDFGWGIYDSKLDKLGKVKTNFHIIIGDDLKRDLRMQREEYQDILKGNIIKWTLWNKRHRIDGLYGELVYQLIQLANQKSNIGE